MMAKSICGGMIAALLSVCAATTTNAGDHSLGSGNGPLGNAISIRSYDGGDSRAGYHASGRYYASHGVRHGTIVVARSSAYRTFVTLDSRDDAENPALAPKAKIIDVNAAAYEKAFAPRSGCVMESGVCVIRGDR